MISFNKGQSNFEYFQEGQNQHDHKTNSLTELDLETKTQNALSFFEMGMESFYQKDLYGAIVNFTKAIEIDCNYYDAYCNRGALKSNSGNKNGALLDLTKAINLDPNSHSAYAIRGRVKLDMKDFLGAISDYTRCIELDPNNDVAYNGRGCARSELHDDMGSYLDFSKAAEISSKM